MRACYVCLSQHHNTLQITIYTLLLNLWISRFTRFFPRPADFHPRPAPHIPGFYVNWLQKSRTHLFWIFDSTGARWSLESLPRGFVSTLCSDCCSHQWSQVKIGFAFLDAQIQEHMIQARRIEDWGLEIGYRGQLGVKLPSVLSPHSSILDLQSSVYNLHSTVLSPQSSVLDPWSSTLNPESSVLSPKSLLTVESKKSEHTAFLLQEYWNNCFAKKKGFSEFLLRMSQKSQHKDY